MKLYYQVVGNLCKVLLVILSFSQVYWSIKNVVLVFGDVYYSWEDSCNKL